MVDKIKAKISINDKDITLYQDGSLAIFRFENIEFYNIEETESLKSFLNRELITHQFDTLGYCKFCGKHALKILSNKICKEKEDHKQIRSKIAELMKCQSAYWEIHGKESKFLQTIIDETKERIINKKSD